MESSTGRATTREEGRGEDSVAAFVLARPRLFRIAYRVLGSAAEAEDIVQEVWLRWHATDRNIVRDAAAFMATATTRLAINRAKSASARREAYVGTTWLADAIDTRADPSAGAERCEALEIAVLMLLESLTPAERAAYMLREAFNYEYSQIAEVIHITDVHCRQLVARARKHLAEGRRTPVAPGEHRHLLATFLSAAQDGDLAALERLCGERAVTKAVPARS